MQGMMLPNGITDNTEIIVDLLIPYLRDLYRKGYERGYNDAVKAMRNELKKVGLV